MLTAETGTMSIANALGLERPPGIISIVGGGGKSSLMFALGDDLPGRVILTTTTRIFAAQMSLAAEVCTLAEEDWRERFDALDVSLLVVGEVDEDRAVGVPAEEVEAMIHHPGVDWVVVEADGSRMRPTKAPAPHEPVIPGQTDLLVVVAGIDALCGPISEVAHRPERVSGVTGLSPEQTLDPDSLALLLSSDNGGLKDAPQTARIAVLLNKVESEEQRARARRVAAGVLANSRVERVLVGALKGEGSASGWEVLCR
jgi:probable selenium-dependent hydroxylase accessory protein YqeC